MHKVVEDMLVENRINDYDENVPNRLLQVAAKLIEDSIVNAKKMAKENNRDEISKEDVLLDDKLRATNETINQQEMLEYYVNINSKPLPSIDEKTGLSLPTENNLTNVNYQLKPLIQEKCVAVNVPSRSSSGNYKIPLQIFASSKNRHLELIQIVENRSRRQHLDYLRKVLFTRRNNY